MHTPTEFMRMTINSINGSLTESYSQGELRTLNSALDVLDGIVATCKRLNVNADTIDLLEKACESLELDIREMTGERDQPMWPNA